AIMLIDGTVSFAAAHDVARMREASALAQRAKVELVPDAELDRRVREAKVTVVLADGSELNEHVSAVRGTADNPMPRAQVVVKCRDLMAPVLGAAQCNALVEAVLAIERVKDVRDLRPLLQKPRWRHGRGESLLGSLVGPSMVAWSSSRNLGDAGACETERDSPAFSGRGCRARGGVLPRQARLRNRFLLPASTCLRDRAARRHRHTAVAHGEGTRRPEPKLERRCL